MSRCAQVLYRGKYICAHSLPKVEKLAKGIGDDIRFWLVQGSYSTYSLSANTHAGGGAGDQELDGYTFEQGRRCETYARNECDLLYLLRWWKGNHHGHWLDPECPNLSTAAAAQFVLVGKGYDALVGNNPDTGDRSNIKRIMSLFNNRLNLAAPAAKPPAPPATNFNYPYGKFKVPGQPKSMYGPSTAGKAWYSGKVGAGTNQGAHASGNLTRWWIRDHIKEIQRTVGAGVDGSYGTQTTSRVKAWQKSKRLTADGLVGPATWAAMVRAKNPHTLP